MIIRFNSLFQSVLLTALVMTSSFSFAQRLFQSEVAREEAKAAATLEVELPKPFSKKDLSPFSPFAYSSLKFFIDKESISFIGDDEVRLTVVTLNESEKYQGIYIGFRCGDFEYRQYGFLDDGVWRRPQEATWRPIPKLGYNQYVTFLARSSTCQGSAPTLSKVAIIEGLLGQKNSYD
jgi:CNP1-like family